MQGELERALAQIVGMPVRANLAGRTDAGVHAWGQVASLNFPHHPRLASPEAVQLALNGVLPIDVAVMAAEEVDEQFHARFSAEWRKYRYLIWNDTSPLPLLSRYSLHIRRRLAIEAMQRAAMLLVGTHDLGSFAGQGMGVPIQEDESVRVRPITVRTVAEAKLIWLDPTANFWLAAGNAGDRGNVEAGSGLMALDLTANAFLPQMIRTIVGTLLEVGLEKNTVDDFKYILDGRDRRLAGPTAKPQGLCLLWVSY